MLATALEQAGIDPDDTYVTNAVKHFSYRQQGKRRIHQRPSRWQVNARLPWLSAELELVSPEVVVLLGATAAQALLGPSARVGELRGRPVESELAQFVAVTAHPSSILRAGPDRHEAMEALVADLTEVSSWLQADGR